MGTSNLIILDFQHAFSISGIIAHNFMKSKPHDGVAVKPRQLLDKDFDNSALISFQNLSPGWSAAKLFYNISYRP